MVYNQDEWMPHDDRWIDFRQYIHELRRAAFNSMGTPPDFERGESSPPPVKVIIIGLDLTAISDNDLVNRITSKGISPEVRELLKRYMKLKQ